MLKYEGVKWDHKPTRYTFCKNHFVPACVNDCKHPKSHKI